jgi:hypothetical protein
MHFLFILMMASLCLAACSATPKSSTTLSIITYQRSGGFIGFDDRLTIDEKGNVNLVRRGKSQSFQLDKVTHDNLIAQLELAKLGAIKSNTNANGNDLITYEVSYKGNSVRTMDTVIPTELEMIIDSLNRVIDQNSKP